MRVRVITKHGKAYRIGYTELDAVETLKDTGIYRFTQDTLRVFSIYKDKGKMKVYEDNKEANTHIMTTYSIDKITNFIKIGVFDSK